MWCENCGYGSESCKMVKCPHCGKTAITADKPFKQAKGHELRPKRKPDEDKESGKWIR